MVLDSSCNWSSWIIDRVPSRAQRHDSTRGVRPELYPYGTARFPCVLHRVEDCLPLQPQQAKRSSISVLGNAKPLLLLLRCRRPATGALWSAMWVRGVQFRTSRCAVGGSSRRFQCSRHAPKGGRGWVPDSRRSAHQPGAARAPVVVGFFLMEESATPKSTLKRAPRQRSA